jgi:hypothetical protein
MVAAELLPYTGVAAAAGAVTVAGRRPLFSVFRLRQFCWLLSVTSSIRSISRNRPSDFPGPGNRPLKNAVMESQNQKRESMKEKVVAFLFDTAKILLKLLIFKKFKK